MSYTLQNGEVLNGGYSVTIGGFTLRNIGSYSPAWECIYDEENSFVSYTGNKKKILKGRLFSIKIKTGQLNTTDYESLVTALKSDTIAVDCPDFTGNCYCDSIPAELRQANFLNTRLSVSFTLIAKEMTAVGGGL